MVAARHPRPLGFAARYALGLLMAVLGVGSYVLVGGATLARANVDFMTQLDRAIPFVPWTVWFYLPLFIFNFHLAIWSIRDRQAYLRTMLSLCMAWLVASVIFYLLPAAYPRPRLLDDGTIASQLLMFLHGFDAPNNTFPSLHVADMGVVALGAYRDDQRRGRLVLALSVLPALSILTTKQHFLADLVGGALLAWGAHALAFRGYGRAPERHEERESLAIT